MKIKLFVVTTLTSDDDGNLYNTIELVSKNEQECKNKVKELHDSCIQYFSDPDDDYDDVNFKDFDISEEDDITIRTICKYEEVEVDI